jgi:hypothetical protein
VTNAAFLLADLLEHWDVPSGQHPEAVREQVCGSGLTFWRSHARAVDHLIDLERTLAGMTAAGEDVSMFTNSLEPWHQAVFAFTTPWKSTTSGNRRVVDPAQISLLRALGALIAAGGEVAVGEGERRSLTDTLAEAEDLLSRDTTLPRHAAHYLWGLIVEARRYLNELELFGPDAVRRIAFELGGAMVTQGERAEANGDQATGSRWKSAGRLLMMPFLTGAAGGAGGEIASEALKQLGS